MAVIKFHDAHMRPPRGGWGFPINGDIHTEYTEGDILQAIEKFERNNQTFVSREETERKLWEYYCRREPTRCQGFLPTPLTGDVSEPVALEVADKSPERQGPPIWTFLNTLAAQWTPSLHNYFLATVDAISSILECSICRAEWTRLVQEKPPNDLEHRLAVCRWVNDRHNAVNAKKGKALYPYWKMVQEFGAPLP